MSPDIVFVLLLMSLMLSISQMIYFFCAGFLYGAKVGQLGRYPKINTVWRWTKWPCLVSVLLNIPLDALTGQEVDGRDYFWLALNLILWWVYRNAGDDDPMDKLRKKLKEKVAEMKGRLVIVPAPA